MAIQVAQPRVLFVAETVTLAHAARPYMLAGALADQPYDVHFAWDPRYEALFPNRAFTEHKIDSIPSETFIQSLAKGQPIYEAPTLRQYVHDDMVLLDAVKPDIVIGDTRLTLSISARLRGVPYVALSNVYWSPYAKINYPIPQHPLTRLMGVRAAQWLFDRARPRIFRQHAKPMNTVRREYGMPPIDGDLRHVYTDADHTWYADVPHQTETESLPANHQFLGPMAWAPKMEVPGWWPDLPTDRPMVYVSLGSSGRADLLPTILSTLAELPISVVAATAGRNTNDQVPANAFVAPYLPGDVACRLASLVIGNGGSPITHQSLAHGTPALGIPTNLDQHLNMQGVVACNAGRCLRTEHVTPQRIADAVDSMLNDDSLQSDANRYRDEMQRFPAMERFKTMLSKLIKPKQASRAA